MGAEVGELVDFIIKYGIPPIGCVVLWKQLEVARAEARAREEDLRKRVRELEDFIRNDFLDALHAVAKKREIRQQRKGSDEEGGSN
jgi:hypothetical protein